MEKREKAKPYYLLKTFGTDTLLFTFIIVLLIQLLCFLLYSQKIDRLEKDIKEQSTILKNTNSGKTVFLGDSITDYYDIDKYYDNDDYINQGIGGNNTNDVLKRLKSSVYDYEPARVVLLIGTNDLQQEVAIDEIVDRISLIITKIQSHNSSTKIFVQSISPVNRNVDEHAVQRRTNEDIQKINEGIKKLCETLNVTYINTYDELIDKDGNFKEEYTSDGIHFSDRGYKKLTSLINQAFQKNK